MNNLTRILIWAAVVGAVFAFLWWKGYLRRLADYAQETREELRKCTWPTWEELKGSTLLVSVSIALLGLFVVLADRVFIKVIFWIQKV